MGYLSDPDNQGHYNGLYPLHEFKCPISGVPLIDDGSDQYVMDSDHFYYSYPSKKYIYARHPFQWDMFRLIECRRNGERGVRFFKLLEDKTWQEYIADKRTDQLFPIGTPKSEINKYVQNENKDRQERKRKYDEGVANGTIIPLPINIIKVAAKSIEFDKVTVQPLSPPSGNLFYTNFKYKE